MGNEFYMVTLVNYNGEGIKSFYFKNKDKAFTFLWQNYLNKYGNCAQAMIDLAYESMNMNYYIGGFGAVDVCGFED